MRAAKVQYRTLAYVADMFWTELVRLYLQTEFRRHVIKVHQRKAVG